MDILEQDLTSLVFEENPISLTLPAPDRVSSPLLKLPNELLLQIAADLHVQDLNASIKTNRRICSLFTPLLHKIARKDRDGLPALQWAIATGFDELARFLIESGAELDLKDELHGEAALHEAAQSDNELLARLLLDHGANINLQSSARGETALHFASTGGHLEIVKLLLEKGIDPNIQTTDGGRQTAMNMTLRSTHRWDWEDERHGEIVRLLLDRDDVDVNFRSFDGSTPLLWTAREGYEDIARILLEKGAETDIPGHRERIPLHWAAMCGYFGIVRMLLDKGSDILAKDIWGATPLHYAAREGRDNTVKLLLERGVDKGVVSALDSRGETPLHWATIQVKPGPTVQLLLAYGADANARCYFGQRALG